MTDPTSFLPYHCEKLNGNFFKPPCERQIAQAEEKRAKFPGAMLGFLEKCLECKGAALVNREDFVVDNTGTVLKKAQPAIRENRIVQDCQNEAENMTEIMTAQEPIPAPRCPKHPAEPQVGCSPDSKRPGQYLGACKVCMADRKVGRKPVEGKEKMTPAVARDLGKKAPPPTLASLGGMCPDLTGEQSTEEYVAEMRGRPLEVQPDIPAPTCNNHPDRPAKIDRLGRSMSLCIECLSARGRKAGIENHERGLTSPPVSIPLNQAKYADIREWLEAQADENERTLQAEIMYVLKLAMRAEAG